MKDGFRIGRRAFGGLLAGAAAAGLLRVPQLQAAAPDGAGAVTEMLAALQASKALSFTADSSFGASVAKDGLKTLGSRASVVFQRPDSLFAVFGAGGEPDVQMLIANGEATLFRLSLASKTVLKLAPENGAAFMVPGLFIPFLGLLADDPEREFFGGITSVTPIAQGQPDQPETTTLAAVMGGRFTGEVWVDKSTSLPTRSTGTWFGAKGDVAASAAVNFSGWSTEAPVAGAFTVKGLDAAKSVELDGLGL
jgi:hypothetical protein